MKMGPSAGTVDLHQLWYQLGIHEENDSIVFDDTAPLAWVRKAIEQGS